MQGDAIARWVRRHPEGDRLLAAFHANDVALAQLLERARRDRPDATLPELRAYVRRLQGGA